MDTLISDPWISFAVAAGFGCLYWFHRSKLNAFTTGAWGLYGVYEYLIEFRILCSGDCSIRVDLLLIYPALAALSLIAIGSTLWRIRKRN